MEPVASFVVGVKPDWGCHVSQKRTAVRQPIHELATFDLSKRSEHDVALEISARLARWKQQRKLPHELKTPANTAGRPPEPPRPSEEQDAIGRAIHTALQKRPQQSVAEAAFPPRPIKHSSEFAELLSVDRDEQAAQRIKSLTAILASHEQQRASRQPGKMRSVFIGAASLVALLAGVGLTLWQLGQPDAPATQVSAKPIPASSVSQPAPAAATAERQAPPAPSPAPAPVPLEVQTAIRSVPTMPEPVASPPTPVQSAVDAAPAFVDSTPASVALAPRLKPAVAEKPVVVEAQPASKSAPAPEPPVEMSEWQPEPLVPTSIPVPPRIGISNSVSVPVPPLAGEPTLPRKERSLLGQRSDDDSRNVNVGSRVARGGPSDDNDDGDSGGSPAAGTGGDTGGDTGGETGGDDGGETGEGNGNGSGGGSSSGDTGDGNGSGEGGESGNGGSDSGTGGDSGSGGGDTGGGDTGSGGGSDSGAGGDSGSGSGGDTGGDTSGGDTSGGDTGGGDTGGGDTGGGDTSGGDTSGGDTSGGDTSGGDTSGGDTSGGDTSGGGLGGAIGGAVGGIGGGLGL